MRHIYRITPRGMAISKSVSAPPNDENWQVLRFTARGGMVGEDQIATGTGLSEGQVRAIAGRLKRQGLVEEG